MALTVSDIEAVLGRFGPKKMEENANLEAPVYQKKVIPHVTPSGDVDTVRIKEGELGAPTWVDDAGALPTSPDGAYLTASVLPKFIIGRLTLARGAVTLSRGKADGINHLMEQVDSLTASLARQTELAMFYGAEAVYTPSGTEMDSMTTSTAATVTVGSKATTLRIGQILDLFDASASSNIKIKVTDVSVDVDTPANSTASFVTVSASSYTRGAGDAIYLAGAKASAPLSLNEICAESGSVHGLSATGTWKGNSITPSGGALTAKNFRKMDVLLKKRGGRFSVLICNSLNANRYFETQVGSRQFYNDFKMDASTHEAAPTFGGRMIHVTENVEDEDIFFVDQKHVKLVKFKDFFNDGDGKPGVGPGQDSVTIGQTNFDYDKQVWGAFNMKCDRRASNGIITGITS